MGVSLLEALQFAETAKLAANRRSIYVKELRRCVSDFIHHVGNIQVDKVSPESVESWLATKTSNPWSRATNISRVSTLFEFAKRRRWAMMNPCDFIERVSIERGIPSTLTPDEATKLMAHCLSLRPQMLAWLSLMMFAGLRPTEARKMRWECIDFSKRRITVSAEMSKVRRSRIVEPPEACWRWLAVGADFRARLPVSLMSVRRFHKAIRGVMGWDAWKVDVLRHTCASMWLVLVPDPGRIAMQLGNSASVLMRHYYSIQTREDAEKFWAIS